MGSSTCCRRCTPPATGCRRDSPRLQGCAPFVSFVLYECVAPSTGVPPTSIAAAPRPCAPDLERASGERRPIGSQTASIRPFQLIPPAAHPCKRASTPLAAQNTAKRSRNGDVDATGHPVPDRECRG